MLILIPKNPVLKGWGFLFGLNVKILLKLKKDLQGIKKRFIFALSKYNNYEKTTLRRVKRNL